jgi:hypothetical protein
VFRADADSIGMAFSYYKTVTIDHTQCGIVDSTDFPVAIWVTDADLKTVANGGKVQNSSGYDIRPYSDSGLTIALTYELVASTYVATTGAVEMHVKIPTVSASSDTLFYLAFGDSGISTDGSSTATWSNGYTLVAHFANGSSLSLADSSGNSYTGTNNSGTAAAGLVDGALAVTGGSNVTFPSTPVDTILNNGDFTLSLWIYPTTLPSTVGVFDTSTRELSIFIISNKIGYGGIGGNQGTLPGTVTYSTGAWNMLQWTQTTSGVITTIYSNSSFDFSTAFPAAGTRSETWHLGDNPSGGGTGSWDGSYDELRLATGARSTSWLACEYNNEKPGSTFLSFGALTPTSSGNRFFLIPN